MRFEIYLNGKMVGAPRDWSGYQQEIVRDFRKRFIRVAYPGTITLTNQSGYSELRRLFEADECDIVRFEAYERCGTERFAIADGNIVLADCEWNRNDCTVEAEVQDDAIGTRIDNNVSIPVSPLADKSKNGSDITPCSVVDLEVFDPSADDSTYLSGSRTSYDWFDAIRHCLHYMTDGGARVMSNWYDGLPDAERIALVNGYQLRTGDTESDAKRLTYDFNALWMEVAKRYNLWMSVRRDNAGTYLSIEPESYMFNDSQPTALISQYKLVQGIDRDRMYSAVEVGDDEGLKNLELRYSLPYLILQGFSKEKFHFSGVCNIDSVLDLVGKWHADTNTIERVLVNDPTSEEYDDDTFLIQYDRTTGKAHKGEYFMPSGPFLYNETMLNVNILNRYALPSDVGSYYDSSQDGFRASGGDTGNMYGSVRSPGFGCWQYDFGAGGLDSVDTTTPPNNNASGAWDVALQRFTAAAQGYYELEVFMRVSIEHNIVIGRVQAGCGVVFTRYDSSDVELESRTAGIVSTTIQGTFEGTGSAAFILNAGDYVTRRIYRFVCSGNGQQQTVTIRPRYHYTGTRFIAAGGGVITSSDKAAARIVKHTFDRHMTTSQWSRYIDDPSLGIGVSHTTGDIKDCHILKASRDVVTGVAKFELISKRSTI